MLKGAIKLLKGIVKINTCENDWGYESALLECSELDKDMMPEGYQQTLPKVVLTHTYIYQDSEATEYVVYFITDGKNQHKYVSGLLKNGKLLWSSIRETANEDD
ncbi:hypothetical protein A5819_000957 [Enterococcus sp. 7E2_DIV0204]|uniref:hypothetical protein n=1 Tax=unclassified Enterococcus TaxID=2608891 RepID=UPI000A34113A|nr:MULTISPECIES: hypothetical protein [unclassified Enterococcus]OTN88476.1 hypothetical protein A5819_000957 [Enterococcus sp. 7E2_DIV0204]OTP50945.1 hypothetical protein A5884_000131 [Enterococcus sp. 7D2_DIV0200]